MLDRQGSILPEVETAAWDGLLADRGERVEGDIDFSQVLWSQMRRQRGLHFPEQGGSRGGSDGVELGEDDSDDRVPHVPAAEIGRAARNCQRLDWLNMCRLR